MYKRRARITLIVLFILTGVFGAALSNLRFDYNFEAFFPDDDPELAFFLDYREAFENDNDYLLIGIRNQEGIFREDFLKKLDTVTKALDSLPLSEEVSSLSNLREPLITPLGLLQTPVLHIYEPPRYPKDSLLLLANPLVRDVLLSSREPAISILIKHKQQISKRDADSLISQVNRILAPHSFDEVRMAGKAYAQGKYIEKMQSELLIFVSISIVLVTIFLAVAFRTAWGVWVPLVVVLLTVVWIVGLMPLTGKKLDIMMVLLPTIMFVVGMSDVVHILTKYIEALRNGLNKIRAIQLTFREVGLATLLTSLTTAMGFLTLLTAGIPPIRQFGLYTALGVFIAFILAFSLLPSIMVLMPKPKIAGDNAKKLLWIHSMSRLFMWVLKKRRAILVVCGLILMLSAWGISRIQINTFLLEDIREGDPLKEDFDFFDKHFGGSKPFEMAIQVRDSTRTVFSPEILREIDKVHTYLAEHYGAGSLVSPVSLAKALTKAMNGGNPAYYRLAENEREWAMLKRFSAGFINSRQKLPILAKNGQWGRISGRTPDWGSQQSEIKNAAFDQFLAQKVNTELVDFKLTGTALLLENNTRSLIRNMLEGLAIAFGVVALIAAVLFRSFRMILITLIPNIIPLLIIAGLMGMFGIYLKLSTSIIFTIAFGIAVDDTIHFISKLRLELAKGKSLPFALRNTFLYTGKAIIITSIILAGGFLTLIFSSFGGTFYTGLLVSVTLALALVSDLLLLPILLLWLPSGYGKKYIITSNNKTIAGRHG